MASGQDGRHPIEVWWRDDSSAPALARALLSAASCGYAAGRALHRLAFSSGLRQRRRLDVPVVSVGNVTAGGAGKTPFVAWLAGTLARRGRRVIVLGRGYARPRGAALNDEGEWLARALPDVRVVQEPDRFRAARAALGVAPADLVLLDDGFQHERLARDLDVVLVDARAPFGNGRLLPRGPLRERPSALRRAHFVFATRAELCAPAVVEALRAQVARLAPRAQFGVVRFEIGALRRGAERRPPAALAGRAVVLLTAVAQPDAVRATIERLGATVTAEFLFKDHHAFTRAELEMARARAAAAGAELVVTAKDAVKLAALAGLERPDRAVACTVLEQETIVAEGGDELLRAIDRLSSASSP